jgi:hypothetical protein
MTEFTNFNLILMNISVRYVFMLSNVWPTIAEMVALYHVFPHQLGYCRCSDILEHG